MFIHLLGNLHKGRTGLWAILARMNQDFWPGAWQVAGPRQGFRPGGYTEQQRPHRVHMHTV